MREGVVSLSPHPVGDSAGPHWGASAPSVTLGGKADYPWLGSGSQLPHSQLCGHGWLEPLFPHLCHGDNDSPHCSVTAVSARGLALGHLIIQ